MKIFNIDSVDFLEMDLPFYFKLIILNFIIECSNNIEKFQNLDSNKKEKILFYKDKDPTVYCYFLKNEEFYELCSLSNFLHKKYIYKKFKTEKNRLVYSINEEMAFVKKSHYFFSSLNDKIFNYDFFKLNGIKDFNSKILMNNNFNEKNSKKIKYDKKLKNIFYRNDFFVSNVSQKKALSDYHFFKKNCCGGIVNSNVSVANLHRPISMITFDIQGFFNSFTIEKIKKHNLFLNIFKYGNPKSSKLNSINSLFIHLCSAFFYENVLPTGAVFSSSISNLLFFSIDSLIKEKVKNLTFLKFDMYKNAPWSKEDMITYTRYIDDIGISINGSFLYSVLCFNSYFDRDTIKTKTLNLNIEDIFEIEKVLNTSGFFIKYEKTKIFSFKKPKSYLGLSYTYNKSIKDYPDFIEKEECLKNNLYSFYFHPFVSTSKKYRINLSKMILDYEESDFINKQKIIGKYSYLKSTGSKNNKSDIVLEKFKNFSHERKILALSLNKSIDVYLLLRKIKFNFKNPKSLNIKKYVFSNA